MLSKTTPFDHGKRADFLFAQAFGFKKRFPFSLLLLLSFSLGVVMYIIQSFNLTSHDVIVYEGQNIRVVFQLREEHSEESLNIICANLYSYLFNITLDLIGTVKTSRSPLRLLPLQYSLPWGNKLCIKQFTAVWRTTSQRDS